MFTAAAVNVKRKTRPNPYAQSFLPCSAGPEDAMESGSLLPLSRSQFPVYEFWITRSFEKRQQAAAKIIGYK